MILDGVNNLCEGTRGLIAVTRDGRLFVICEQPGKTALSAAPGSSFNGVLFETPEDGALGWIAKEITKAK